MICPKSWADAHHDGVRYGWWVLTQAMQHPRAPWYWWITGTIAILFLLPVLQGMALVLSMFQRIR